MIRRVFLKTLAALTGLFVAKTGKPDDKPLVLTATPEDVVRIQAAFSGLLREIPKPAGGWSCRTHRMPTKPNSIMVLIHRHWDGCSWSAGIALRSDFGLPTSVDALLCVEALKHAIRACEFPLQRGQHWYDPCCQIQKLGDQKILVLRPVPSLWEAT